MKKPKDVAELASRLSSAASTPLVAPAPAFEAPEASAPVVQRTQERKPQSQPKTRTGPRRSTVSVFLRLSQPLYEQYDQEAVRRTKATGRGVTVQQVILDRLAGKTA